MFCLAALYIIKKKKIRKAVLWHAKIRNGLYSQFVVENHFTRVAKPP